MAQATRSRSRGAKAKPSVTPEDILSIADDVSQNILIERKHEMRVFINGILAGSNIHLLGPPGTGKSLGLREMCRRIVGGRYFEKAVHPQMPADAIIGGYDMAKFAKTGEFERNVEHYAPNAHFLFLDEVTRANGPTLDALLPIMNTTERRAEANGGMFDTPIEFVATASNFMPDPDDPHLGALVDRFTLMLDVEYVKADDSFREMLRRAHTRTVEAMSGGSKATTITLEQFQEARALVKQVKPSADFLDKYAELRRQAKQEGLNISDRRWVELMGVAKAPAWLAGRDEIIAEDIAVLEPGLWRDKDHKPLAHKLVLPFHGRFEREAETKRQEASKPLATFEQIRPVVEGTPPNEELDADVMRQVVGMTREVTAVKARIDAVYEEAKQQQKDASALRDLSTELRAVQEWCAANGLPSGLEKK